MWAPLEITLCKHGQRIFEAKFKTGSEHCRWAWHCCGQGSLIDLDRGPSITWNFLYDCSRLQAFCLKCEVLPGRPELPGPTLSVGWGSILTCRQDASASQHQMWASLEITLGKHGQRIFEAEGLNFNSGSELRSRIFDRSRPRSFNHKDSTASLLAWSARCCLRVLRLLGWGSNLTCEQDVVGTCCWGKFLNLFGPGVLVSKACLGAPASGAAARSGRPLKLMGPGELVSKAYLEILNFKIGSSPSLGVLTLIRWFPRDLC